MSLWIIESSRLLNQSGRIYVFSCFHIPKKFNHRQRKWLKICSWGWSKGICQKKIAQCCLCFGTGRKLNWKLTAMLRNRFQILIFKKMTRLTWLQRPTSVSFQRLINILCIYTIIISILSWSFRTLLIPKYLSHLSGFCPRIPPADFRLPFDIRNHFATESQIALNPPLVYWQISFDIKKNKTACLMTVVSYKVNWVSTKTWF